MQVRKNKSCGSDTMSFEDAGRFPGWRRARRKARKAQRKRERLAKKLSKSCKGGSCFAN